ncbi:MAG: glycoside hydrolase family 15 protein, partial [Actinomycetota bacterium]|nr:glycoside hydrolase family 15 protein [Actinomycetota bacterium]
MNEAPISDYALIGDTRTAALCASTGSIDWMCAPRFDSEPIFGKLIGGPDAGSFAVTVDDVVASRRRYGENTAIVETEVESRAGTGRVTEGMAVEVTGALLPQTVLVRKVVCERGRLAVRILFDPKLGLPGRRPRASRRAETLICDWGALGVTLQSFPSVDVTPGTEIEAHVVAGSELILVMTIVDRTPAILVSHEQTRALLDDTKRWWEKWVTDIHYDGPFRPAVLRSLITLQLLTFSPSGAPVAAPTTSLPEEIAGVRNWDYRFSWPRDASIGLAAFLAVGRPELAHSFMHWLLHASRLSRPHLKVLYTLYGKPSPKEREVAGVPGYRGSVPVRIGNDARVQHQLDVYGWVVDAAWLLTQAGHDLHAETWRAICGIADVVAERWREPDAGIWEVRGDPLHYVHSKMMAWLCLHRALRIAEVQGVSSKRSRKWTEQRDRIRSDVRERGWNTTAGSYVRSYG